jgi:hypothetical protein
LKKNNSILKQFILEEQDEITFCEEIENAIRTFYEPTNDVLDIIYNDSIRVFDW